MQLKEHEIASFAIMVANAVVEALDKRNTQNNIGNCGNTNHSEGECATKPEKTAYQKTEQLLYNYNNFKRIIKERELEIENLRKYGVPKRSTSIVEYSSHGNTVGGIVLPEESVESAIRNVQASVQATVQALALIDKCMETLKPDPYYQILEMRYFESRTQEDIAEYFGCSQVTISKNKSRLVRELSLRLFPNQSIAELMK